ncbi:MAG: hypothetical protein HQL24_07460 [Candidatus Omnitrophica bacterium]|nr:hypothetical protein [Candidatus Omnitrophota bacterium]
MENNSFTFNFKKLPWAAITVLCVALLFEIFNRVFDDRMYPFPYDGLRMKIKNQISQTRDTGYDVLIMGDCFNLHGINPLIIEKETGLKVFNYATHSDYTILTSYILLKNHLEHNRKKPSIIVINFIPELTVYGYNAFNKRSLPFLFDIKEGNFFTLMKEIGFQKAVQLQFYSLKNSPFFSEYKFVSGLADAKEINDFKKSVWEEKGYYRRYGEGVYTDYYAPRPFRYQYRPSPFFEKYLRKILDLARENHIFVFFPMITAPEDVYENLYRPSYMIELYFSFLANLKKEYPNLFFWGWQSEFSNCKLYRDTVHLNHKGCALFSQKIAQMIFTAQQKMQK